MGTKLVKAASNNFNPCYFFFSVIINVLTPNSLIFSRFSLYFLFSKEVPIAMLIAGITRYLIPICVK